MECPTEAKLESFLADRVSQYERDSIEVHLSSCDVCGKAIAMLADDPTMYRWHSLLRESTVHGGSTGEHPWVFRDFDFDSVSPIPEAVEESPVVAAEDQLAVGDRLGEYNIKGLLGAGSYGNVYLAHHVDNGDRVALKLARPSRKNTKDQERLFAREIRNLRAISHPGVVELKEVFRTSDDQSCMVMEYVKGTSLKQLLQTTPLSIHRLMELLASAAEALSHAHRCGVYHRDIKPANLVVRDDGSVCVVDFGLSIHLEEQASAEGVRAGTVSYMSPEQMRGESHLIDGRADIWALGVILYEAITGERPFGGSRRKVIEGVLNRPARPPRELVGDVVPRELERICLAALVKDPDVRTSNARDMADDLRGLLANEAFPPKPLRPDKLATPCGRAEVELAQRARYWSQNPTPWRIPGPISYLRFLRKTSADNRSDVENRMMKLAARCFAAATISGVLMLTMVGMWAISTWRDRTLRVLNRNVARLATAAVEQFDDALDRIDPAEPVTAEMLQKRFATAKLIGDNDASIRYAIPFAESDPAYRLHIAEGLLSADAGRRRQLRSLALDREFLRTEDVVDYLWRELQTADSMPAGIHHLWPAVDLSVQRRIGESVRLLDNFAFCESLPMDDFLQVAEELRASCYRPVRIRPFRDGDSLMVAAIWTRDSRDWEFAYGLSKQDLLKHQQVIFARGFDIVDVASYAPATTSSDVDVRYGCLCVLGSSHEQTQMLLGVDPDGFRQKTQELAENGWRVETHSTVLSPAGVTQISALLKRASNEAIGNVWHAIDESYPDYFNDVEGVSDAVVCRSPSFRTNQQRYSQQLALAEQMLGDEATRMAGQFQKGRAHYYLADDDRVALACLSLVIEKSPEYRRYALPLRAMVYSRLGMEAAAVADLDLFAGMSRSKKNHTAYALSLRAKSAFLLGQPVDAVKILTDGLTRESLHDIDFCAASAFAVGAAMSGNKDPALAQTYRDRAVELLTRAAPPSSRLESTADLNDVCRGKIFESLLARGHYSPRFSAVWNRGDRSISRFYRGESTGAHAAYCKRMIKGGWYPHAISTTRIDPSKGDYVASVWKKKPWFDSAESSMDRRAMAAAVLLRVRPEERIWRLLAERSFPQVRTELIHCLRDYGPDVSELRRRIFSSDDPVVRQGLVLALGEYDRDVLEAADVGEPIVSLAELHESTEHAGVRSAIEWCFRCWGQPLGSSMEDRDDDSVRAHCNLGWQTNRIGQTMITIQGPGEVSLGATKADKFFQEIEVQRNVVLDYLFAVSSCEVSVKQFRQFDAEYRMPEKYASEEDGDKPAHVSFFRAAAFCNWLSALHGIPKEQWCYLPVGENEYGPGMRLAPNCHELIGFRMPMEMEWEYVCRAGSQSPWSHGQSIQSLGNYAWHLENSPHRLPSPVGMLKPNAWGFFDMHGNAAEWCSEYWSTLMNDRTPDPFRVLSKSQMVVRGGSFALSLPHCRSAVRLPGTAASTLRAGFRVARTIRKPSTEMNNADRN